jgi:8-oxo-dGTP pyrophosphatase MutT (NUDIX family)
VKGRVNQGEGFEDAVNREVFEETGLHIQIEMIVGLSHFYHGDRIDENELQGVAFACRTIDEDEVKRSTEHSEHRWMLPDEALDILTERIRERSGFGKRSKAPKLCVRSRPQVGWTSTRSM